MGNKDDSLSKHHIVPRSMGGLNEKDNIIMLRNTTHRAIHTLFANQMFARQLLTMTNINQSALRADVIKMILDILDKKDMDNPYDRYKPTCFK